MSPTLDSHDHQLRTITTLLSILGVEAHGKNNLPGKCEAVKGTEPGGRISQLLSEVACILPRANESIAITPTTFEANGLLSILTATDSPGAVTDSAAQPPEDIFVFFLQNRPLPFAQHAHLLSALMNSSLAGEPTALLHYLILTSAPSLHCRFNSRFVKLLAYINDDMIVVDEPATAPKLDDLVYTHLADLAELLEDPSLAQIERRQRVDSKLARIVFRALLALVLEAKWEAEGLHELTRADGAEGDSLEETTLRMAEMLRLLEVLARSTTVEFILAGCLRTNMVRLYRRVRVEFNLEALEAAERVLLEKKKTSVMPRAEINNSVDDGHRELRDELFEEPEKYYSRLLSWCIARSLILWLKLLAAPLHQSRLFSPISSRCPQICSIVFHVVQTPEPEKTSLNWERCIVDLTGAQAGAVFANLPRNYPQLTRGATVTFPGQIYPEAFLAPVLPAAPKKRPAPTLETADAHFGVSKKCYPTSASILRCVHQKFGTPDKMAGAHIRICPSAFLPEAPTKAMERVVREYRKLLRGVLLRRFGIRETTGREEEAWQHEITQRASWENEL